MRLVISLMKVMMNCSRRMDVENLDSVSAESEKESAKVCTGELSGEEDEFDRKNDENQPSRNGQFNGNNNMVNRTT